MTVVNSHCDASGPRLVVLVGQVRWYSGSAISDNNLPTSFDNLMKSGALSSHVFPFYLGNNAGGELTFGVVASTKYTGMLRARDG